MTSTSMLGLISEDALISPRMGRIGMKRRWPRWLQPKEMAVRHEKAAKWANGMPGGSENRLGLRAMYIYANDQDTL